MRDWEAENAMFKWVLDVIAKQPTDVPSRKRPKVPKKARPMPQAVTAPADMRSEFLWYKDARSDKVYHLYIEVSDKDLPSTPRVALYNVRFEYGKRGRELLVGYKCRNEQLVTARAVFDKHVSAQLKQGYRPYNPNEKNPVPATPAWASTPKPSKRAPRRVEPTAPIDRSGNYIPKPALPSVDGPVRRRFARDEEL